MVTQRLSGAVARSPAPTLRETSAVRSGPARSAVEPAPSAQRTEQLRGSSTTGEPVTGDEYATLPEDLPEPNDDGEADHLPGSLVPSVTLAATDGTEVDLSARAGPVVVYCYPKTGRPGEDVLPDNWEEIPGARGCTPESCGFRDHYPRLLDAGIAEVFGLSVQSSDYQREARDRLELPFELLSDSSMRFADGLDLPTFDVAGETLLKRSTLVLSSGRVDRVFYPVFPPDEHAAEVLDWAETRLPE